MEGKSEDAITPAAEEAPKPAAPTFIGEPWERQPQESPPSWEAFTVYRNMGAKRSTAKVARELSKSKTIIDRWCSANKWVKRIEAYELDQDREYRANIAEARKQAAQRHASNAQLFQEIAIAALRAKFGPRLEKLNAKSLKNGEIIKFFVDSVNIERKALGEGEAGDSSGGGDGYIPPVVNDSDRKPIVPITFVGRIEGALDLLEAARARKANDATEEQN